MVGGGAADVQRGHYFFKWFNESEMSFEKKNRWRFKIDSGCTDPYRVKKCSPGTIVLGS